MRALYWFRTDLRLHDNPGLAAQRAASSLLLVYLWPVNRPWCNVTGMGAQRERFLAETLRSLGDDLAARGQSLLVLRGAPERVIPRLVREYGIEQVATAATPGYHERRAVEHLQAHLTVPLRVHRGTTLYDREALPFPLRDLPGQFTPFRRAVERLPATGEIAAPEALPPSPALRVPVMPAPPIAPHPALPIRGGSAEGHRRLHRFVFEQRSIATYKDTRDCLDGLTGSSTLSPWLSTGALSVREVAGAIRRFETGHGRNESTQWLYSELLWREYFHWRALQDDVSLFRLRPGGGRRKLAHCTFEPRAFARWCAGDTDYPLVNALMQQLVQTGWMSNRGRQIAASCLVNELGLDWRYGAAFFEKHLLDYDVASNYGNWQYIAGVGADPRGGRHFDLEKQARLHDPDGEFTTRWGGWRPPQPKYVNDAADWPILRD